MRQGSRILSGKLFTATRNDQKYKAWQKRQLEILTAFRAINIDAEAKFPLDEVRHSAFGSEYSVDPTPRIEWRDRKRRALVADILAGGIID